MKSNQRVRFLTAAALAIGAASFSYAEDRPAAGSDRTNNSDTSRNDRQDRAGDNSNRSSSNNANSPDTQAVAVVIVKTVDAALNGDVRQISQNFGQRDQRRFEDANKDQAQQQNTRLQQATADLKRNYREKYNKDLSLADASKTFGSDFIRPSGGADTGDRARPAGSRIEGSGTGASNTTGSGAAGSGTGAGTSPNIGDGTTGPRGSGSSGSDRTITANSGASGNGTPGSSDNTGIVGTPSRNNDTASSQSVSIPASHGLAEVRLNLVKEGSDWKINVPSTLTPDRLQDNLARELNRANDMKAQWPADANDAQRALAHHVFIAVMDQDSSRTNGADRGAGTDRNSNSSDRDRDRDRNTGSTGTGTGSGAGNSTTGGKQQ
ncbi:MAG: hypothetical protein JWN40_3245 [Phycisphaerales bacterium]|nr:hypothetical protein [Phycisphaerales bacterium]